MNSWPSLREVLDEWDRRGSEQWTGSPDRYRDLARAALALGHPTLACEVLREALTVVPADAELRYLAGLAHAKIGGWRAAAAFVAPLLDDSAVAPRIAIDARSLAGRIAKDRWARHPAGAERAALGAAALAHYRAAWDATQDPFPGINAATLAVLTGDANGGRELARAVMKRASATAVTMDAHWREATLGEAAALLGDFDAATRHYLAAVVAADRNVGHVAAMRRQLKLIARAMSVPAATLDALAEPQVVVFTGHMIDSSGRAQPRFPAGLETPVAAAIAATLDRLHAGFGYCSAASGADLLFIEAMLAGDREVHVTLPFERGDFVTTSVAPAGPEWVRRFDQALRRATSVSYGVHERFLGDEALFEYAGALTQGAAMLRAHQIESEPVMLAVLDGASDERIGGTHATLGSWRRLGLAHEVIDLAALRVAHPGGGAAPAVASAEAVQLRAAALRREVKTMLFADVVGFSKLSEEDTPAFLVNLLGTIAEIIAQGTVQPEFTNTWGDGLFMVFADVAVGADAALRLRDAVLRTDWPSRGLPAGTSIRIGMHSGPVFPAVDPIIGRRNFFGSHVNRAARIEPVTTPGAVFVSEAMACLLAASGASGLATDYLGTLPLAKGFGSSPLYRLRRIDEAE